MQIKDIMTWNVITVPSDMPIMEARKIMETHKIRRLPVVDRGKLVGIVTLDRIIQTGPSTATSLSIWEINYLLAKMKVKEVMEINVHTVTPDASVEQALASAQSHKVGAMPVLEGGKVVGIVTTNDFVLKLLNTSLGIGKPGTRLNINNCNQAKNIREVMDIVDKQGLKIVAAHTIPPADEVQNGFSLHVDTEDASKLIKDIEAKGYKVKVVSR
ncbi:MAG: CBS domain-containing protein [Dehalococcoidia bacterium]|nr:CBS domain-containing protein [Dehalococcoidia bacterium]MDD5494378.1 CBS domain-containing protein [Dehalococcoidia bacterium]